MSFYLFMEILCAKMSRVNKALMRKPKGSSISDVNALWGRGVNDYVVTVLKP